MILFIKFNKEQIGSFKTLEGPLLIITRAGRSNTDIITTRITYLIEELGTAPINNLEIFLLIKQIKK